MSWLYQPIPAGAQTGGAAPTVTAPGGLHHIEQGIGDTNQGARVAQTLHTIDQGISA